MLGPFFSKDGSGGYGETAFFHKVPTYDLCVRRVFPCVSNVCRAQGNNSVHGDTVERSCVPLFFITYERSYVQPRLPRDTRAKLCACREQMASLSALTSQDGPNVGEWTYGLMRTPSHVRKPCGIQPNKRCIPFASQAGSCIVSISAYHDKRCKRAQPLLSMWRGARYSTVGYIAPHFLCSAGDQDAARDGYGGEGRGRSAGDRVRRPPTPPVPRQRRRPRKGRGHPRSSPQRVEKNSTGGCVGRYTALTPSVPYHCCHLVRGESAAGPARSICFSPKSLGKSHFFILGGKISCASTPPYVVYITGGMAPTHPKRKTHRSAVGEYPPSLPPSRTPPNPPLSGCVPQFALTFQPSSLVVVELKKALFDDAPQSKMKEVRCEWTNLGIYARVFVPPSCAFLTVYTFMYDLCMPDT